MGKGVEDMKGGIRGRGMKGWDVDGLMQVGVGRTMGGVEREGHEALSDESGWMEKC